MSKLGKRARKYKNSAEHRASTAHLEAAWEQLRHLEIVRTAPSADLMRAMTALASEQVERAEAGIAKAAGAALGGGADLEEVLMALLRSVSAYAAFLRGGEPYPASEALVRANEVFTLLCDMRADSAAMIYLLAYTAMFVLIGVEAQPGERGKGGEEAR